MSEFEQSTSFDNNNASNNFRINDGSNPITDVILQAINDLNLLGFAQANNGLAALKDTSWHEAILQHRKEAEKNQDYSLQTIWETITEMVSEYNSISCSSLPTKLIRRVAFQYANLCTQKLIGKGFESQTLINAARKYLNPEFVDDSLVDDIRSGRDLLCANDFDTLLFDYDHKILADYGSIYQYKDSAEDITEFKKLLTDVGRTYYQGIIEDEYCKFPKNMRDLKLSKVRIVIDNFDSLL